MTTNNNQQPVSPWLQAAIEMNELLKQEPVEVQESIRAMNRKRYPQSGWPSNDIDEVGFPEGQILPHCNGDASLCGELSAKYHLGEEFPPTGNQVLDDVCERLTQTSGYGQFAVQDND
jgi:hypothetical protein